VGKEFLNPCLPAGRLGKNLALFERFLGVRQKRLKNTFVKDTSFFWFFFWRSKKMNNKYH